MNYLDKINSVKDLKKLNYNELEILASEIRHFLVEKTSVTGGHLSSNLGVVEITLALNYVFDFKTDKIVFDVGHQSYVHKILTGRKDRFDTLRKLDGLSGFPKISESEYDSFDTGHSTTSISVASGFCTARDTQNLDYSVIALIGDGAMTGGMSFEAMNNIGRMKQKMIVILNDNQMSISENVGAVSKTLNQVRLSDAYTKVKKEINDKLSSEKVSYKYIKNALSSSKNTVKSIFVKGQLFEQMGFTYLGPVDGHNIIGLIEVLQKIDKLDEPVILHINTKKGLGYKYAVENSSKFHGISPFDKRTGEVIGDSKISYSDVVGNKFLELLKENKKLLLVSAAMISGTGIMKVKKAFPKRVHDVGICEQHATTYCAAMAQAGLIPVFLVYSTFLQRAYDQIVHDVCITNQHVIFMIDRAGIVGADGETHQGIFDISFLSHIPNMTILAPKSAEELEIMMDFAVDHKAPIAIRYPRGNAFSFRENAPIKLGKSETVYEGEDILIVTVGHMFEIGLKVYEMLKKDGLNPTLVNTRFIKPIDEELGKKYKDYKKIITIEENVFRGSFSEGFGFKLFENKYTGYFKAYALEDSFIEQGTPNQLREKQGITALNIYRGLCD